MVSGDRCSVGVLQKYPAMSTQCPADMSLPLCGIALVLVTTYSKLQILRGTSVLGKVRDFDYVYVVFSRRHCIPLSSPIPNGKFDVMYRWIWCLQRSAVAV